MMQGTKISGYTRGKVIPSMKTKGTKTEVLKSTTCGGFPELFWVHHDGHVIGVVSRYEDGECHACYAPGDVAAETVAAHRFSVKFIGSSALAMAVGAIIGKDSERKS